MAAEATHRDHAIVEAVFADLKDRPLAHAPSGKFTANAAWLALAAIAFNLTRAAARLASATLGKARTATVRRTLIAVAAGSRTRPDAGDCTYHPAPGFQHFQDRGFPAVGHVRQPPDHRVIPGPGAITARTRGGRRGRDTGEHGVVGFDQLPGDGQSKTIEPTKRIKARCQGPSGSERWRS